MDRKVPVGLGPRRRADLRQPRVPRRHPRRPRLDQRASPASRPRRASRCSCCYSIFRSGVLGRRSGQREGAGVQRQGRGPAVPRPRATPSSTTTSAPATPASACPPSRSPRSASSPRRCPTTPAGGPFVTGRTSGVVAVLVDARRVLPPGAAALRLRRRRGRAQPVHDGHPPGRGAAQAAARSSSTRARSRSTAGTLRTYAQLVEFVSDQLTDEDARRDWAGPGHRHRHDQRVPAPAALEPQADAHAGARRPARLPGRRVSTEGQQVTVVDLHNLPERAQRFVVGVVLADETARKEAAGAGGLLFTMIDELNKYAPREGSSPIKEVLLDIAERGRSLGIILIGAQQTASEVERRIVSNSSIKVVGTARPGRGRAARVRLPAAVAAGTGRCSRSRAPCSCRSRRSRCRWPSSSRSRRGRRGSRSPRASPPPGSGRPIPFARLPVARRRRALLTVRFLHTADWHVGKTLKGRSRLEEQEQVLREIVGVARAHEVDAVLVAGDLYDTAAPYAAAQQLVVRTLLGLARDGVRGRRDRRQPRPRPDPRRLPPARGRRRDHAGRRRCAPPTAAASSSSPRRSTGERATVAVLPFLSQRYAVRAAELVAQHAGRAHQRLRPAAARHPRLADRGLPRRRGQPRDGPPDRAATGRCGGGEREPRSRSSSTPCPRRSSRSRRTTWRSGTCTAGSGWPPPCPVHYSGAPLAVDFGEQENEPVVCLVDAAPGTPAHGHRRPDHGRPAAAHRARHASRSCRRSRRRARRRLPAGLGPRAGPGRAARGGDGPAAERARGAHRPGVRRARSRCRGPAVGTGAERAPRRAVRRVPRGTEASRTRGSSELFARLHDEVTGGER